MRSEFFHAQKSKTSLITRDGGKAMMCSSGPTCMSRALFDFIVISDEVRGVENEAYVDATRFVRCAPRANRLCDMITQRRN